MSGRRQSSERRTELKLARRAFLVELKGSKCLACEATDTPFHFHHRDPATKTFKLTGNRLERSWLKLYAEVAKCDLLCEPCHREAHRI